MKVITMTDEEIAKAFAFDDNASGRTEVHNVGDVVYVCHVDCTNPDDERASLEQGILSGITDEGLYEVTFLEKLTDGTIQDTYHEIFSDKEEAQECVDEVQDALDAEEFLRSPEFQWERQRQMDKND
jgi:hypothetical protein